MLCSRAVPSGMRSSRAVISGRNKHCPQLQRGAAEERSALLSLPAPPGRRTLHFAAAALCTLRPSRKGFGRSRTAAPKLRLRRSGWGGARSDRSSGWGNPQLNPPHTPLPSAAAVGTAEPHSAQTAVAAHCRPGGCAGNSAGTARGGGGAPGPIKAVRFGALQWSCTMKAAALLLLAALLTFSLCRSGTGGGTELRGSG